MSTETLIRRYEEDLRACWTPEGERIAYVNPSRGEFDFKMAMEKKFGAEVGERLKRTLSEGRNSSEK